MLNKKVTLQAKKNIIASSGSHKPGEVFKCFEKEATFLLKLEYAIKIGKSGDKVIPDSEEKADVIKLSKKEKTKAEKFTGKKVDAEDKDSPKT